jgi:hypothetical protein
MDIIILVKLALKHELLEFKFFKENNLINYNRIELLKKTILEYKIVRVLPSDSSNLAIIYYYDKPYSYLFI